MMITKSIGLWNDKEAGEGMKVNTDCTDRFGRSYMTFSGYKSIDDVYLWLNQNGYSGYKFGVVIDCMPDEMCEPDKKLYVYFLDELMEEVAHYCDFYRVDKDTYKRRW